MDKTPESPHNEDFCLSVSPSLKIDEVEYMCIHNYVKRMHQREMTATAVEGAIQPEVCTDLPDMQHETVIQLPLDSYALSIVRLDGIYTIAYLKPLEIHD